MGAHDCEEDLDESTKSAHTHTAGRARSAGSNLIREYGKLALMMTPLIYEYMNLFLHFQSRSLMTSHYAKRISGILHEAGRTVAHVLWMQTPSLSIAISLTHMSWGLIERKG